MSTEYGIRSPAQSLAGVRRRVKERCPEHFMPLNDGRNAPLKRCDVKTPRRRTAQDVYVRFPDQSDRATRDGAEQMRADRMRDPNAERCDRCEHPSPCAGEEPTCSLFWGESAIRVRRSLILDHAWFQDVARRTFLFEKVRTC